LPSALTYVANIAGSIIGTMGDRGPDAGDLLWSCVSMVLSFSIGLMALPIAAGRARVPA
jgi:hypothetical protein